MTGIAPFTRGWQSMNTLPRQHASIFDFPAQRSLRTDNPRLDFYQLGPERIYVTQPVGDKARANILLSHGLTEHAGRHFNTARWLAALGYRTIQFDLAGHGGRENPLDDSWWIYEAFANGTSPEAVAARLQADKRLKKQTAKDFATRQFEVLSQTTMEVHLKQIERILDQFSRSAWNTPETPFFLFGHSMGGLLCTETAYRFKAKLPNLKGLILSSPAFRPQGRPGEWLENRLIDAVWENRDDSFSLLRAAVKGALSFNVPYDTTWSAPWISDQDDERHLYLIDPLVPDAGPSSYASAIEDLMVTTGRRAATFPTDGLMLLPGKDGVTSVAGALDFAGRIQAAVGPDRFALVRYEQSQAHDLLRSGLRQEAQRAIADWLNQRLA